MERPKDMEPTIPENAFTYDNYLSYLETKKWADLRNQRLKLDDYKCAVCGSPYSLEVHHLLYPRILGTEHIDHVVTLCRSCHQAIEERKNNSVYRGMKWTDSLRLEIYMKNEKDKEKIIGEIDAFFTSQTRGDYVLSIYSYKSLPPLKNLYKISLSAFRNFIETHPDMDTRIKIERL